MSEPNDRIDRIDLTPAQWRDRAYVLDALRTRLGELEIEARIGTYEDQQRARQAVEGFVAALFDHTRPPLSLSEAIIECHRLAMTDPWAEPNDPPPPNPFGMCSDEPTYLDQGEGPEC